MKLTPEEQAKVDNWNALGEKITDNTLRNFIPQWFANIRALLKTDFPLHGVEELAARLGRHSDSIIVLGSGPSAQVICRKLSASHPPVLCGPTALGALLYEGVRPAAIIVADSSREQYLHVAESLLTHSKDLDIVLPVIADPAWYSEGSEFGRDHLYFFLPYMDYMGDINISFNHILHALFPDVATWIGQAGSVAALAVNVADMVCGVDPDKRVLIGVDFSWTKGAPRRAPLRYDVEHYSKLIRNWHEANMDSPPDNVIDIGSDGEMLQSDLVTISYATQLFYLVHSWIVNRTFSSKRFSLISDASKLYRAVAKGVSLPCVDHVTDVPSPADDAWAYKIVLALINLFTITKEESSNGKSKETSPSLDT